MGDDRLSQQFYLIMTSHHEAGHAIMALLSFMQVSSLYLANDSKDSKCIYEFHADFEDNSNEKVLKKHVYNSILVKYAGIASEKHLFKTLSGSDKFPVYLKDGSSNDTMEASNIIKQYNIVESGTKRYAFKKKAFNDALSKLKTYWDDLILLSNLLFKKKRLNSDKIKNLLTKKSKNKDFWKNQFRLIEYLISTEILSEIDLSTIL